jgi:hypothetical protein
MADNDGHMYIHTYLCACARVCVSECVRVRACTRVCVCLCVRVCAHACARVCVCLRLCARVCVCVTQLCCSFALLQPATSVRLCARLAWLGLAECDLAHSATAHLCHGTHAFVGQANEVVQCQFAQEGAVLAQADTPTKQWGPRVTSVERATPNRSAPNAATRVNPCDSLRFP